MSIAHQSTRRFAGLALAVAAAVATWLYVNHILRARQVAEAALHDRPRGNLSDLYPRWLGARELLLHRRDPYGADVTRQIQAGYYGRLIDPTRPNDPKDPQAFAYPVYVVFVLAPTLQLPFSVVQKGFLWALIGLTALSVLLWLRVLGWQISATAKITWMVLVLGSFPAIQGFKLQQLSLLVAVLLAGAMYAITRRHLVGAGMLLAVASIKPQLIFLPALWLLIWATGNWRERRRLLWSFAASTVVLVVGGEILLPGWIGKFRAAAIAYYQYTGGGQSVLDVLLTPLWGKILAAILVLVSLFLLCRRRQAGETSSDFQWSLSLVLATTLLVIPMFAPYNQVLLLPVAMQAARQIRHLWRGHRMNRVLLAMAAASLLWPWLAAAGLCVALFFLPGSAVQQAWALPLLTNFAIPVTLLALVLGAGSDFGSNGSET